MVPACRSFYSVWFVRLWTTRSRCALRPKATKPGLTLRLFVAPADLGKVIGKQGRTARAIRTLLSAIAAKSNQRLALDVVEAE